MERLKREMGRGWRRGGGFLRALVGLAFLLGGILGGGARAAEVRFVYSPKGEILAVIDVDGSAAVFKFDARGNVLSITRTNASGIAGPIGITLVSPGGGNISDTIEIFGKGLANPTSVTFYNGIAATVLASDENYIKTVVPTGAATGRITVTTSLGSATSPSNFTILATMSISPTQVALLSTRTRQFTASTTAVWSVDGAVGGNATTVGTISTSGLYTAPATGPFPKQVIVAAHSATDPTNRAEAVVEIIPNPLVRSRPVSAGVRQTPAQTKSLRAAAVSAGVTQTAPQTGPLQAADVSAAVDQTPAQTRNLEASAVAVERQPVITAVSPASLARGSSNVTLTLTGQGLANPTALQFLKDGTNDSLITYNNLTASSDTQATVTISIASTATIAGRVIQITAGGVSSTPAGTGTNVLQVTGP